MGMGREGRKGETKEGGERGKGVSHTKQKSGCITDPQTSWVATMKNDLSYHNHSVEDTTELALDRPLWRLLAASRATL